MRTLHHPTTPWLALTVLLVACGGPVPSEFDRPALEQTEELSEALANDLLALSVAIRGRDAEAVERYFAEEVSATPFPGEPPPSVPVLKWIQRRQWPAPAAVEPQERERFLAGFEAFFWRFDAIDDARFKVEASSFDPGGDRGSARLKFFVVGRDAEGRREWLEGKADAGVRRGATGPWQVTRFQVVSLQSKLSTLDLFSEVAGPAGVAAAFPAFGEGANQGFVAHGAATADVNGDGLLDVAASGVSRNYLYLNEGDGRFRDASRESLVEFAPPGSGVLFLDYDNDGDPDLFLANVGRQVLLQNRFVPDGVVEFRDVSGEAGVDREAVGFSAVSADVNGDGFPDVYVCSYNLYGTVMPDSWLRATNGTPNLLLLNRGDGTFADVAAERGVDDGRWSYAAGFVDIDADGDQDLYVANDFGENAMYRNEGDRFVDVAEEMGLKDPGFGMGVAFGDYDNDGDLDLHITNMSSTAGKRILERLYPEQHELGSALSKQAAGNSLYRNLGDGRFEEVTDAAGGLSGGWAFGGGFIDFDNDGWEDLYTPNGFVSGKSMKDT